MKFLFKTISFLFVFLLPLLASAQESGANNAPASVSEKAQRQKAKKEWKKQRQEKKIHDKEVKEYHKMQTKKVQKRMKKDKRKATLNNEHRREFFLIRWFSKKK